jgi:hypothetical protein
MAVVTKPVMVGILALLHMRTPTNRAIKGKRVAQLWVDVVNSLHDLGPKKTQVNPPLAKASWQTRCNSCRRVGLGLLHKYRCQAMQ